MTNVELGKVTLEAAGHLHAEQRVEAARTVAEFLKLRDSIETEEGANAVLQSLLAWLLNADQYELAAKLLWTPNLFTPDPRCTQLVWQAFREECAIMLMGAASMSKSYSGGVWLLLDWLRDPVYTNVKVIGPSEQHLRDNLFTHLVDMHRQSSLKLPGEQLDLFIGLDPRARRSAISGVVIPIGKKAAGRLQGAKRVARPKPHPTFGPLTRMRIFIDEIENVQNSLWGDIDNVISNVEGLHGFKLAGAFNPRDITSQVATRCEPEGGWDKGFDREKSESWVSQRGWRVVRLDALKSENVIAGKTIYHGLQTREGIERIIINSGGVDTPGYDTFVRACYPRRGALLKVIPEHFLNNLKAEVVFVGPPIPYAGVDVALSGGDAPKLAAGRFGPASCVRFAPSLLAPKGLEIYFKDSNGNKKPRMVSVLDQLVTLEPEKSRKPTVALAQCIMEQCKALTISPGCVMIDRTGNGAGVHDVLQEIWSREVMGTNFMENAGTSKIMVEDTLVPKDAYGRVYNEVWFALRKWIEFAYFYVSPLLDTGRLYKQLADRNFDTKKYTTVEDKPSYKARHSGESPDDADAVTLFLHAIRRHTTFIPSAVTHGQFASSGIVGAGWGGRSDEMPCRVDCTNRLSDDV